MPVSVALTADGKPSPALLKKMEAKGIPLEAIAGFEKRMDGKSETFFYQATVKGAALAEVLAGVPREPRRLVEGDHALQSWGRRQEGRDLVVLLLVSGEDEPQRKGTAQRLAMLNVSERIKAAMQGTREERSVLVRDPNRLVSSAVLSSPKLTESEVEAIARMANVSDEVLRIVGTTRNWIKNYNVISALTRNAKTPIAISLNLLNRLVERDIKMLASDRNIPEPVRVAARKLYVQNQTRRQ